MLLAPASNALVNVTGRSGTALQERLARPHSRCGVRPTGQPHNGVPEQPNGDDSRYGPPVELGYALVHRVAALLMGALTTLG